MERLFLLLIGISLFYMPDVFGQSILMMQTTGQKFNVVVREGTQVYLADSNAYYKVTCTFGPLNSMRNVFKRGCYILISGGGVSQTHWESVEGDFISPKNDKNVKLSSDGSVYLGDTSYISKDKILLSDTGSVYFGEDYIKVLKVKTDSTLSNVKQVTDIQTVGNEERWDTQIYCDVSGFSPGNSVILKKTDDSGWSSVYEVYEVMATYVVIYNFPLSNIYDTIYKYTGVIGPSRFISVSKSLNIIAEELYFNDDYIKVGYDSIYQLISYSNLVWSLPYIDKSHFYVYGRDPDNNDPFSIGDTVYFDGDTTVGYEIASINSGYYVVNSGVPYNSDTVGILGYANTEQHYFESSKSLKLPDTALYIGTYPLRLLSDSLQIKIDDTWKNIKLEDRVAP